MRSQVSHRRTAAVAMRIRAMERTSSEKTRLSKSPIVEYSLTIVWTCGRNRNEKWLSVQHRLRREWMIVAVRQSRRAGYWRNCVGRLRWFFYQPITLTHYGRVAELADAQDLKSCVLTDVRVRVPPRLLFCGCCGCLCLS